MGYYSRQRLFLVLLSGILCILSIGNFAYAQNLRLSPETSASIGGGLAPGGIDLAPSNPLGLPGNAARSLSEAVPLSSGMFPGLLPIIPNLEIGFNYSFGPRLQTGRFYADYLLPFFTREDGHLFGEAHAEGLGFWKGKENAWTENGASATSYSESAAPNRFDLSLGGGYRRIIGGSIVGANAFYDSTRLWKTWYPSWGWGLEMFSKLPGESAFDLQFNHYGNQFNRNALVNVFRTKGASWDLEAGYSVPLLNQSFDLRMKFRGYQFDSVENVYGWNAGAEVTTRNGSITLRYEHGQDRVNGSYDTIGGFVNVGFQMESLLKAENPFTMPQPVFGSPRNELRTLTRKVIRDWHQPIPSILRRASASAGDDSQSARRLVLVNVSLRDNLPLTVDIASNTYTVTNPSPGSSLYTRAYYDFRMSDNSVQSVRITTYTVGTWLHLTWGESLPGSNTIGPQMMNAPTANTRTMFGTTAGWHHLCFNTAATGYVVFDVPGDPSIVPLVVQIGVN